MFKKSWKTTLAGVLTLLTILSAEGKKVIDDDPTTTADFSVIVAACGAFFIGLYGRDATVSSEQQGIKP